jgi:hypothetical protein
MIIFIIICANVCLSIIDNELYISISFIFIEGNMEQMNIPEINHNVLEKMSERTISTEENLLRCINMICSFTVCGILIIRYNKEIILLKNDLKLTKYDGLYSSGLLKYLILEILVCGVFYPPKMNIIYSGIMLGSNYVYNLNSIFSIFIMT